MPQIRVNVRAVANTAAVRQEKRNGRDVLVVPSATLPDDVIMNGIKYPSDEIEKSFKSLERSPAPYGHPKVNGKYVSARDPEGINVGHIGAWNDNVRRENGRVFLDKVIDIEVANQSANGKAVLEAINKGGPVHTSTGLLCEVEQVNATDHDRIARNILFDHDAILLNEEGAATPDQGVGMLVNGAEIEVVNSALERADMELDWAVESIARAIDQRQKASALDRMKAAILEVFGASERDSSTEPKEDEMSVSDEQFNKLSAEVKTLSEGMGKIGDTIGEAVANAVKPLTDNLAELQANAKAKDEAELTELRNAIVKANLISEEAAKDLTLNTARELAKATKPKAAFGVNAAFGGGDADEWDGYDLNANMKDEK